MDLVDSIVNRVLIEIDKRMPKVRYGTWVSAEATDANLSRVTVQGGTPARMVPKLSSVGTPSVGNTVVLLSGGGSGYTIIGILSGNRSNTGDLTP